jgi:putative membrane protein
MVQHLLLMVIAAPLILLGVRLSQPPHWHLHLVVSWLAGSLTVILWHVPAIFEFALRSPFWHEFAHASFFIAGILFWWPVIQPEPGIPRSGWSIPIYLFLATLPCDALSAFLAFCGHIVYRPYSAGHRLFSLSPVEDQALAGALMWVTVTFAYLIPALVTTAQLVSGQRRCDAEI